jgi:hypothetical protein
MLSQIKSVPPVQWAMQHPRLAAWIVLSVGMVTLLAIEARDVGLLPGQWLALMAAAVLVAGACVWIISWEDEDEAAEAEVSDSAAVVPSEPKPEE